MTINVDRMRRYSERIVARAAEAEDARTHAQWLAGMTAEHRARHEGTMAFCGECLNKSLLKMTSGGFWAKS